MQTPPAPRRVWVDLANSPQVHFFAPLIRQWEHDGLDVLVTSRPHGQTCGVAERLGLRHEPIGLRGTDGLIGLGLGLLQRARLLLRWARGRSIQIATSHNSYAQLLSAKWLGVPATTSMDFEYHFANHLAFRLAWWVVVPEAFPEPMLRRFGASRKAVRYPGVKEQLYLASAPIQPDFRRRHGLREDATLAVVRPAAEGAAYHPLANPLVPLLLAHLGGREDVQIVFLPRNPEQAAAARAIVGDRLIVPTDVWDGPSLLATADLVLSAGGTMVREAAVLGTPAYSLFGGQTLAVDKYLARLGRLAFIRSRDDIDALGLGRVRGARMLLDGDVSLRSIVAKAMLGGLAPGLQPIG